MGKKVVALEISRNGERLCLAAVSGGVVTASVGAVNRRADGSSCDLTVSGFRDTPAVLVHPWWIGADGQPELREGDAITIRVMSVPESEIDPPAEVRRKSKLRKRR